MRSKFSFPLRFSVLYLVGVLSLTLLTSVMFGQTVTTVLNFTGNNGMWPTGPWTQGRDGRLYGTTSYGGFRNGAPGPPAAFVRFDHSTQNLTIYHRFNDFEGQNVSGGVTLGSDNYFYGTTSSAGDCGLLYRITVNGTYTVLHNFSGGSDGCGPMGPPIEATDGNFYGTTSAVIYKLTRNGDFSVIHIFDPSASLYWGPSLMQGSDGKLYVNTGWGGGTGTGLGGGAGCGSLLKVSLYGALQASYSFPCAPGGETPNAGALAQASDGNFYGATLIGGSSGVGNLYQLTPAFGVTSLYSFGTNQYEGAGPNGSLVQGTDGILYGATSGSFNAPYGGSGTLFQWSFSTGFRQLYGFPEITDYNYNKIVSVGAGLMQHTSGLFYGSTTTGGSVYRGSIFSLDMGLGPFVALVRPHGKVGSNAQILGQGLTGTSSVTFNGIAATSFNVVSDTYMTAVVPSGATTGPIVVTTPTHTLTSNRNFTVP